MANGQKRQTHRQLDTLIRAGAVGRLTDGELLERFTTDQGEAAEHAFAALVERHGPMVLRVCTTVLRDPHEALDAFQATFLILLRKAGTIRSRDSLASWLHGVAHRVASCARSSAARRHRLELRAPQPDVTTSNHEDCHETLHDELSRLPDRYLAPIVLCHLEGLTHEQAANQLDWPVGTVRSRLARGRERLKLSLTRRGLAPSALLMGLRVSETQVPASLVVSTLRMATREIPTSVAAVVGDTLRASMIAHIKTAAILTLAAGVLVTGAVVAQSGGSTRKAEGPAPRPTLDIARLRHTDEIIDRMLETTIDLDFPKPTKLEEIIKFIKAASKGPNDNGLPIYVDPTGLIDARVTLETPVAVVAKMATIKTALNKTLGPIGLYYHVNGGLLIIASRMSGLENRLDRIEQKLDGVIKALDNLKPRQ